MTSSGLATGKERPTDFLFLLLAAMFLSSLVTCNLIAGKLLIVDLGFYEFRLSAGALPYPLTFLVTDLLSELYGRRRATKVVWAGFVASLFALSALWLGEQFHAYEGSPGFSDETYREVFGLAPRAIAASMTAYLVAQFIDVRMFHYWKTLTKGRHLWLRNNASTIVSQLLDSVLVIVVLFWGKMTGSEMTTIILDLWLFKALVALADTPLFYLGTWYFQRKPSVPI
ncbi:MAG TPA: VUT family protein [Planctomycetes bacterium]|nr:VUT family protein [Planctomycetota bacterium]